MARKRTPHLAVEQPASVATEIPDNLTGLKSQEAIYQRGNREGIVALRTIRQMKLFRHHPKYFPTFDNYVEEVWHRTRQWATQEINWLRVVELFEEKTGKAPYQGELNKEWAQQLRRLMKEPDELIRAYTEAKEEEKATGKSIPGWRVKDIVNRRLGFIDARSKLARDMDPSLQFKEYIVLRQLNEEYEESWPRPIRKALKEAVDARKDVLVETCRAHKRLPGCGTLLEFFRCDELEAAVLALVGLQMEWDHSKHIEAQQEKIKAELAIFKPRPDGPRIVGAEDRRHDGESAITYENFCEAVGEILEHYWNTEITDYEDASTEGKAHHVFRRFLIARNYLEQGKEEKASAAV